MGILTNIDARDPGTPTAVRCKTLDLNVRDGYIHWSARDSNLEGYGFQGGWHPPVKLNLDDDRRETIELLAGLLRLLVDVSPSGEQQRLLVDETLVKLVNRLGELLYGVLFSDPALKKELTDSMAATIANQLELLRVELEFLGDDANLAFWPWEYLCSPIDPDVKYSGKFLVQTAQLVLNRTSAPYTGQFSTRTPVLLLVVSRPKELGPVLEDAVETKLKTMHDAGQVELHQLVEPKPDGLTIESYRPTASWIKFLQMVKDHKPHIIHFIGHGRFSSYDPAHKKEIGELAFVSENGKAEWISESVFADSVKGGNLRLVFLQACESALADPRANISGVAMQLAHQNVPAVIAMQSKIRNDIANEFAVRFYEMLGNGAPIDWAVKEAREQVRQMKLTESQKLAFGTPVVYLNSYLSLIERPLGDRSLGLGEGGAIGSVGKGAASTSTERHPQKPTTDKCPHCCHQLNEVARLKNACPRCNLQLRCPRCREPLDYPDPTGCFCGECRNQIAPLEAAHTVRFGEPSAPLLRGAQPPSIPSTAPDLEDDLRKRFPSHKPPGSG